MILFLRENTSNQSTIPSMVADPLGGQPKESIGKENRKKK
jgi:hypothetical protein